MQTVDLNTYLATLAKTSIKTDRPRWMIRELNTHRVMRDGLYLGCNFDEIANVNQPHFGPRGLSYAYSETEARDLAAAFGGEVVPAR